VQSILVDAGPLIALTDRSDKHHRRIVEFAHRFKGELLTTWPVLAEACHFLPERLQIKFLRWAAGGSFRIIEVHGSALGTFADWKERYHDLPMDLADASLLWAAQETGVREILTIDLRDFAVYRLSDGKALVPVM